jgi:hypothetical protein
MPESGTDPFKKPEGAKKEIFLKIYLTVIVI